MEDCIMEETKITLSNEEIVNQWDAKVRRKLLQKLEACDNEKAFEDVLKDYLRVLQEQATNFKEKKVLLEKISRHLKLLHLSSYSLVDRTDLCRISHLDYMENILIFLCSLELESVCHLKRIHVGKEYNKTIRRKARKLITNLSINLLHDLKRIIHVLLKLGCKSEQARKDIMHIVYRHYLINLPVMDRSDLNFCRYYLLFQKWKSLNDKNAHPRMDRIMFFKFRKEPEDIKTNKTLQSILVLTSDSVPVMVQTMYEQHVNAYFKFIAEKNEDDQIHVPQAIELDSDEEDATQLLFEPSERERRCNGFIKSEQRGTSTHERAHYVEISAENGQVVCVIDDDSDIEEVCVQNNKSPRRRRPPSKSMSSAPITSFLDLITLSDEASSSSAQNLPSMEEERPVSSTHPAEGKLPYLTTFVESARKRGIMETELCTVMGLESLSISVEEERESASRDVLNTNICCENGRDLVTQCVNKSMPSEPNNGKNLCSSVSRTSIGVQSTVQSETIVNKVTSSEVQNVNSSGKCTCCCRHDVNINNSSNNSIPSETNKTNENVIRPNQRTVEIQTENLESYNYLCGMITPPSDRTADENSPTSMENTCTEGDMQSSGLRNVNTNVYAYVPNITVSEPYTESNSHAHYESDVETNSNNDTGICEISTQVCSFDQANDTQSLNESTQEENVIQNSSENVQEQKSNLEESLEGSAPTQTEEVSRETEESDFAETHVEHNEHSVNEIELPAQMEVAEMADEPQLSDEPQFTDTQINTETQVSEEDDFDEPHVEESEEVLDEFELTETHLDDAELVSEIELNEETLEDVDLSERTNTDIIEKDQHGSEFVGDTSDVGMEEAHHNYAATSNEEQEQHQIVDTIKENCVLNETESTVNNVDNNDNTYTTDFTNVPIIITEAAITASQDSSVEIIPVEVINNVILDENYENTGIVMVPNIDQVNGESTKFTVYKLATDGKEPSFVAISASNELNNCEQRFSSTIQNESLNEKNETLIIPPSVTKISEPQCHRIQASVTMTQLMNTTNPKSVKNGEHLKTTKRKRTDESGDKIIFTSDERVKSAPLSVFAQFEQAQSDLVENAFCGPIEPINGRTNIDCDNSNSNDSFCLFDLNRSLKVREFKDNPSRNSPLEGGSPISPPYESIHAQEYENHILRVNMESLGAKSKSIAEKQPVHVTENKVKELNREPENKIGNSESSVESNKISAKRKPSERKSGNKRLRVNFGETEVRLIPRERNKVLNPDFIAWESMDEYNISYNDSKLMYLKPTLELELEPVESAKAKMQQRNRNNIFNTLMLAKKREAESTCIKMRVDYKKSDNLPTNKYAESSTSISFPRLLGSSVQSVTSKQVNTSSVCGYMPALNSPKPGLKSNLGYRVREDYEQHKPGPMLQSRSFATETLCKRGRRKGTTSKVQQLKSAEPPPARKSQQKRPRGRPRKTEKRRNSQSSSSVGVLYSDGPFRLG